MRDVWGKVEGIGDVQLREKKIKNMITVFKYLKACYKENGKQLFSLTTEQDSRKWL